jgi:crescentin
MDFPWLRTKKELSASERALAIAAQPTVDHPAERPGPETDTAVAFNAPLDMIGLRNEALRQKIEDVEDGFGAMDALRDSYRQLIAPMADLLGELETAKSGLHETRVKYGMLQEAHTTLKARHNVLSADAEAKTQTLEALNHENRDLRQRLHQSETALERAVSDLRERVAMNERLERQLEIATRDGAALDAETKRMKQAIESRDAQLAQTETQLKTANDSNELLRHELAAQRAASAEIAADLEARNRRLAEIEPLHDQNRRQLAELEVALATAQNARSTLEAQRLEENDRHRGELASANHKVEALRGRGDIAEKLLADARDQLRGKVADLRAAERQLLEGRMTIDGLEKKLRMSAEDLAKAEQRIAGMDDMRATLVDRVNGLIKAVQSKESTAVAAEQKADELTRRHDDFQQRAQRERERAERDIAELREMLERERSERILAEGALQASRHGRVRRNQATGDGLAEAAAMEAETTFPVSESLSANPGDAPVAANLRVMTP